MKRLFLATALIIGFSGSALSTLEYSIGGLRSHAQDSAGARLLRLTHAAVPTEASPTEIIFWQSIQNGDDPADFNIYLEQYPDGAFAALARNRLKRLEATTTEFPEETISGIVVNKDMIPFDERKPMQTSGLRLGTPALTTRGMKEAEMTVIAGLIDRVIRAQGHSATIAGAKGEVLSLCEQFSV